MVLFFMFTLRCGGSKPPPYEFITDPPQAIWIQRQRCRGRCGHRVTLLSARILEYTCQILHTCPAISPTLAVSNLYDIVNDLSIYRLFLQKSAVLLDKKMNSSIELIFKEERFRDAYVAEALCECARKGDYVDISDVRRNIKSERARNSAIEVLREFGLK